MKKIAVIFFGLFTPIAIAATLSPTEIKIRDAVIKQKPAQILFLKKIVNINSGTNNIKGVRRVGMLMQHELQQLGFKTRWVSEPKALHRAPTLIAEREGHQGKRLLLIGHLDTVFADGKNQHLIMKKNSAKGPGITDDKGGLVVLLYSLKALKAAGALNNTSITIVLTGDEEDSGKPTSLSRKPLIEAAKNKDVALDFEPAITLETITIARRGISNWTLSVQGNESHSAAIFQKDVGDGAIFEMARVLTTMRLQLEGQKYLSFNPGMVLGGTKVEEDIKTSRGTAFGKQNVVAKVAVAKGDVRFIDAEQRDLFKKQMQDIAKQSLPGTKSQITFEDGIPAMPPTENNEKLLEQYSAVSVDLGMASVKAFDPALRGAGDISYVAAIVPANLSGLGPIGFGTHSVSETLELHSLSEQTERAAILIHRLTQ